MALTLTKISETSTKITLGWMPVAGAIGYRFQSEATTPKWSHTWDATRSQVTFSKADWYVVEALGVEERGNYPEQPEPQPGELPFAKPTLTNPIELTIPSLYEQGKLDADFNLPEAGRDYRINLEGKPRHGLVLRGPNGGVSDIGNVIIEEPYFRCTADRGQSDYRRGGIRFAMRARHIYMEDYFVEALDVPNSTQVDGIGIACAAHTKVTLQRALIEAPKDSDEAIAHMDALQIQGPIGRLELGVCTLYAGGHRSHPGKGLQLDLLAWNGSPGPFVVDMRKVDMTGLGVSGVSTSTFFIVQGKREINIQMEDVYAMNDGAMRYDFPQTVLIYQGDATHAPTVAGTKPNRTLEWKNPATNIDGLFRERPPGTHFVSRQMLGH